ncbi:MAG: hypothetical protein HOW73_47900 [Polyangiaceae bacterium]|nr:hypothetical protein [Polyangiaceae bacterium]
MTKDEVVAMAGPHQTVQGAKHPELGEGWAVHQHGAPFFAPEVGDAVRLKHIGLGGAGEGFSYLTAVTEDGRSIRLDTTKRERGDHHKPLWHPRLGVGWLIVIGGSKKWDHRFEADSGEKLTFSAARAWVGKPGKEPNGPRQKPGKPRPPKTVEQIEWDKWMTYESYDGEVFVFRDSPPPAEEPTEPKAHSEQPDLFGGAS